MRLSLEGQIAKSETDRKLVVVVCASATGAMLRSMLSSQPKIVAIIVVLILFPALCTALASPAFSVLDHVGKARSVLLPIWIVGAVLCALLICRKVYRNMQRGRGRR